MSTTASARAEAPRSEAPEALFRRPPLVEWFRSLYQEVILLAERVRHQPSSDASLDGPVLVPPAPRSALDDSIHDPHEADDAEPPQEPEGSDTEAPTTDPAWFDTGPETPSGALTTAEIHGRLLTHLETPPPGVSGPQVNEVRYAMAALADEVFIHLGWSGASSWRHHLLESALFDTHRAGEEIFRRIDHLIQHGDRSHRYAEVALVYLLMLALGFQGKHRGNPRVQQIVEDTRRNLYRFLSGRTPEDGETPRVSPAAYAGTLAPSGPRPKMPYLRRWIVILGGVVLLWLLIGHALWLHLTDQLRPMLEGILG